MTLPLPSSAIERPTALPKLEESFDKRAAPEPSSLRRKRPVPVIQMSPPGARVKKHLSSWPGPPKFLIQRLFPEGSIFTTKVWPAGLLEMPAATISPVPVTPREEMDSPPRFLVQRVLPDASSF